SDLYKIETTGPISKPTFSGNIALKKGLYINPNLGIYIKNITVNASIKNNNILIKKINGNDDLKSPGSINGSGKIMMISGDKSNIDLSIALDRFCIMEIKNFDARFFGKINIKGDIFKSVKVTGEIYANDSKLDISNLVMMSSRSVDILEPKLEVIKNKPLNLPVEIFTDINIFFKNGLKIVGYGTDSLWNGSVKVSGNVPCIKYGGKILLTKGIIQISGRSFILKHGIISIDNSNPDLFKLNVSVIKSIDMTKVGAKFSQDEAGSIVRFFSKPYMSQRDILSYMLFDKPSNEISATEGITLLAVMNKSSKGNIFGIIEKVKTTLGIDTMELKKNVNKFREEYDAVSIGKQMGNIKVSVDQGTRKDTTKIILESKLSKHIKISVDANGKDSAGGAILWSKRY
ncbi:MAG: translocation/assembly module TamB domain-containing protein, partial [Holosporales bacterium]|nr:translocation/assembly module TamB domain-containing protein [Holosporales bacterium]